MSRHIIVPDLAGNGDRSGSKPIGNFMPVRTAMLRNRSYVPRCYETALLGPYSRLIAVEIARADAIHIDTRAGEFSHLFGPLPEDP